LHGYAAVCSVDAQIAWIESFFSHVESGGPTSVAPLKAVLGGAHEDYHET